MSDIMTFPDTWEEYEKSYGFTDNEEVYTNGARLIPSFRVKQWLDHLPSEQPFTDEEIQKMQDLEFAEIEKAYETGLREGRKNGKWIIDNPHSDDSLIYIYACSECNAHHRARYDFCPSCGADMKEGEQDG